jgi:hypothetical protein
MELPLRLFAELLHEPTAQNAPPRFRDIARILNVCAEVRQPNLRCLPVRCHGSHDNPGSEALDDPPA